MERTAWVLVINKWDGKAVLLVQNALDARPAQSAITVDPEAGIVVSRQRRTGGQDSVHLMRDPDAEARLATFPAVAIVEYPGRFEATPRWAYAALVRAPAPAADSVLRV